MRRDVVEGLERDPDWIVLSGSANKSMILEKIHRLLHFLVRDADSLPQPSQPIAEHPRNRPDSSLERRRAREYAWLPPGFPTRCTWPRVVLEIQCPSKTINEGLA